MYLQHFGLDEAPFRITPATGYFFAGAQRGDTLAALEHALNHDEGIVKITGEVGSGKTMLLRMLLDRLPATTVPVWLSNPSLDPEDLLRTIAFQLGAEVGDARPLLDAVSDRLIALWSQGRRAVALIDEAHAMPTDSLEQVRLLSNLETPEHKLLQIVLFGQPELDEALAERTTRPILDRITHHFELAPLDRAEVAAYVEHRLARAGYRGRELFTGPAIRALTHSSEGLTRRINILADKAMLAAFATGARYVGLKHVRLAARDARLRDPLRPLVALGACIAVAGIAGAAGAVLWERSQAVPQPLAHTVQPAPAVAASVAPAAVAPAASAVAASPAAVAPDAGPAPSPVASAVPAGDAPFASQLGGFLADRLMRSQAWLASADGKRWCVQVGGASPEHADQLERLVRRLDELDSPQPFHLYAAPGAPIGRIGVVWGEFGSAAEAQKELANLPEWVRRDGAYVRSIASLRPRPPHKGRRAGDTANSVKMLAPTSTAQETDSRP
jgi:type II secretory pathway predicted ATPase ExeA